MLFLLFAGACSSALAAPAQFVGFRISQPLVMDGRLDAPAWQQAPVVNSFSEVSPFALKSAPYPTEVRVLYDSRYVYIGFKADDPKPANIRGHFVRRDRICCPTDEDYVFIYLDALNTGRSAQMFGANLRGDEVDGIWNEDTQNEDYTPDFDWAVTTARSDTGWTAVMRIPFTSLRYHPGKFQTWKLIAWRGIVRENYYQEASTQIPQGNNCLLCYAGNLMLVDFPTNATVDDLVLIPEATVIHASNSGDFGNNSYNHTNLGGYFTWQPNAATVVDGVVNPDFSQVESDDFQPTANNQFVLFFPEKRPFFLESNNLLASPLQAIYTRSITTPRWGLRVTQENNGSNYTVLAGEDKGGGSIIEPGLLFSTLVPQHGRSTVALGSFQLLNGNWRSDGLFTYRRNADGSHNLVVGPDWLWTPNETDRLKLQYIYSSTLDPDRPDLFAGWAGQSLDDHALYVDWTHSTGTWTWEGTYQRLGSDFRAWAGFIPQVGIRQYSGNFGRYFYPVQGGWINSVLPQLVLTRTDNERGGTVLYSVSPTLLVKGAHNASLTLAWYPGDQQMTAAGLQRLRYETLVFTINPTERFTYLKTSLRLGENADFLTGNKGYGPQATVTLGAFPLDQLELDIIDSFQRLSATNPVVSDPTLFEEHGAQLHALWYFNALWYVELSAERDKVSRDQVNYSLPVNTAENSDLYTFLVAYELSPQSHFYAGYRRSTSTVSGQSPFSGAQRQFFAKMAYEFPM